MSTIPTISAGTPFIGDSAVPLAIPLKELQERHENKRLVAGVAIVANDREKLHKRKLLLVRRSSIEDVYPLMYEIPGRGAEKEDENILATAIRETREETGLKIVRILGTFEGFEYATRKGKAVQFNFLAEVEDGLEACVVLDPSEHEEYAWVGTEDDISKYPMTESMSKVVNDALEVIRSMA